MPRGLSWSIELSAVGLLKAGSKTAPLLGRLPAGTRVYLPALAADPPSAIEDSLRLLQRSNPALVPVPHIAASRETSVDAVEGRIDAWQKAWPNNVHEVLVVRGDPGGAHGGGGAAAPVDAAGGAFASTLEFLETGVLQRCGVDTVGLCGHPEGVGGGSADDSLAALAAKLEWAEAAAVRARVVTQFCFYAEKTTGYVDALRDRGVDVDVSVGVVGPDVPQGTRERMAGVCGVSPPPRGSYATPYMRRLARWQEARGPQRGMQALHLYPFASLEGTLAKMHAFETDGSRRADGSLYEKLHLDPTPHV